MNELAHVPYLKTSSTSTMSSPPTTTSSPTRRRGPAVVFGTSGHRGSSLDTAFNEAHIVATTAAIVEYRRSQGTDGTLYLSAATPTPCPSPPGAPPSRCSPAPGSTTAVDSRGSYTPTPAVSHSILRANGAGTEAGVRTERRPAWPTASSSPPPTTRRATAASSTTRPRRPRRLRRHRLDRDARQRAARLRRGRTSRASRSPRRCDGPHIIKHDYLETYVADLESVIDIEAIRKAGVRIGADPLGGASVDYWGAIGERYGLELTVVNPEVDPAWHFMTLDWDGKIRMDCSSPNAMASLR